MDNDLVGTTMELHRADIAAYEHLQTLAGPTAKVLISYMDYGYMHICIYTCSDVCC